MYRYEDLIAFNVSRLLPICPEKPNSISTKEVCELLRNKISRIIQETQTQINLALILFPHDKPSIIYRNSIVKKAKDLGINITEINPELETTIDTFRQLIKETVENPDIHGIMPFLPFPGNLKDHTTELLQLIPDIQDIDGINLNPDNETLDFTHYPVTPQAIMALFWYYGINLKDKNIVLFGANGRTIGKPLRRILSSLDIDFKSVEKGMSEEEIQKLMEDADITILATNAPHVLKPKHLQERTTKKDPLIVIDAGMISIETENKLNEIAENHHFNNTQTEKYRKTLQNRHAKNNGNGSILIGNLDPELYDNPSIRYTTPYNGLGNITSYLLLYNVVVAYKKLIAKATTP